MVTLLPKPADDTLADASRIGMVTERLPLVHIGDVNFNKRNTAARNRIAQGDTCVRPRPGIDHRSRAAAICQFADFIQERAFVIALEEAQFHVQGISRLTQRRLKIRERRRTVDPGLSLSKAVKVRSVKNGERRLHKGRKCHFAEA